MTPSLPPRYGESRSLLERLQARVVPILEPNQTILDVGAGRLPTIPPAQRPTGICYVGLDIAAEELSGAPDGAYDEVYVGDITQFDGRLAERFEVATSCHVLEHVRSVPAALENLRRYLRPDGRLMMLFASTFSAHAIANRVLPEAWGARLLDRPSDSKFPAVYDNCWPAAVRSAMTEWSYVEIVPLFLGAHYFARWPLLQQVFLHHENWAQLRHWEHLTSHMLLLARR
ncbi:MAG: class I SAM-dependent methyltransferase [Solirubrobacteraceae bacterium]